MSKKSYLLALLLCEEEKKGWSFTKDVEDMTSLFYGIVKTYPARYRAKLSLHASLCEQILKCI
jgi:hypothetical protein